jgi:hypothetical protein
MTREELIQLRDAIDMTLALPDSLRGLLAQWLAPATAKTNGHDRRSSQLQSFDALNSGSGIAASAKAASTPRAAKPNDNPAHAPAAEQKLLAAMREYPGLSAGGLAKAVGAGLSTTKERLRRMGAQELIQKAPDGRWQVKEEEPRSPPARDEPDPTSASPN